MQDRYVGDAGDFGKYGLLRYLAGVPGSSAGLKLGVVWYLVDDESHNEDGRHLAYLTDPILRECDPELHDALKDIIQLGERRVSLIEQRRVFPEGAAFFSERISSKGSMVRNVRMANRREWFKRALAMTQGCDLVFLDPDNGLEIPTVPRGSPKSHKYVLMEEVQLLLSRQQSVLIYQHMHRRAPHKSQVAEGLTRLRRACSDVSSVIATTFRRGSVRTFFLLTSSALDIPLRKRLADLDATGWGGVFEVSCEPGVQSPWQRRAKERREGRVSLAECRAGSWPRTRRPC